MTKEQEDNGLKMLLCQNKKGVSCFNTGLEDIESMRKIKYNYELTTGEKLIFNYDDHYKQNNVCPRHFPELTLLKTT